eukprot:CAMPEP_0116833190 /NCGR_PEP_ID=MMETSP0418-20121206/6303_1 /TAXON_ID=1158023 /ORGANISM="Astrosyne radiata, Strain 13vi08-1A" /LENGTH=580 /DNA_ID=CAMNT_0004462621 /DNA_START=73 /DNA_END=1815 /DNA_ORIENTATION=+
MRQIGNKSDAEECKMCYKALLDEERRTNTMVDAEQVRIELDLEDSGELSVRGPKFKAKRATTPRGALRNATTRSTEKVTLATFSSADWARMMEKQSAVLSLAEKDASLGRYGAPGLQRRSSIQLGPTSKTRRRKKTADEADLKDFDYSAAAARALESTARSGSPKRTTTLLKPQKDTPRIPAPPRPTKRNSQQPPKNRTTSQQQQQQQPPTSQQGRQAAFDAFGVEEPEPAAELLNGSFSSIPFPGLPGNAAKNDGGGDGSSMFLGQDSRQRSTANGFDPFAVDSEAATSATATTASSSREDDNGTDFGPQRISELASQDGSDARGRIQVNIALNEDLTCSYKQSKISSCTIEGVVQVQVRSDSQTGSPFFLLLRDPSRHVRMIQENRRYADDMTETLSDHNEEDQGIDYKFTISVPRADNYFPVMRYKCSSELRPVPIRVQTRVRVSGGFCRVALQISSNPANEDDLTDLTIIMGVPNEVRGETLTTSPHGGVWNAAKRSVIWCVAELGDGEKFQLQAQFEIEDVEQEKPKFPVLVRCQCMYAQLSDIELEVADIPEVFPAEVTMKLARRFRLSHRERS